MVEIHKYLEYKCIHCTICNDYNKLFLWEITKHSILLKWEKIMCIIKKNPDFKQVPDLYNQELQGNIKFNSEF